MWNLFERKFLVDERNPVAMFETDHLLLSFFSPDPTYILQMLTILGLTAVGGNFLSLIVCQGILRNKQTALLLTFGVVLPITLYYPFFLADLLDIRSSPLRMTVLSLPLTCTLRTLNGETTIMHWYYYFLFLLSTLSQFDLVFQQLSLQNNL